MRNSIIEAIDIKQTRDDLPKMEIGQNVAVSVRIKEGDKERIQIFEGLVIAMKGTGATSTFTVRKMSYGVGVERTFFANSPIVASIKIERTNRVRRAKLYYMRDRKGKAARLEEVLFKKQPTAKVAKNVDQPVAAKKATKPKTTTKSNKK